MLTTTVCAALSAAGLAVAFLTAFRRRFAAATRIAAFSLVPVGLAMSGLIGLAGKIGKAVGTWAADLVLKPSVWAGFAVLAVAFVLYVIGRFAGRRSRSKGGAEPRATAAGPGRAAASGTANAPALGSGGPASSTGQARKQGSGKPAKSASDGDTEDFSDIEAILKKHGI
ncbi:hypothetical protein DB35_21305 [Streptomyces abyssalis]|uniref:Cellulose synthase n=1 Tax=Streptomyces abyssalis TaxID=933944 RepID=A0A1E7JV56_9ACTN|nr:hypothetical protein [Streptomyces abyssalis]OEU88931.1 hypothetical protein DB35_21305 [Streptomyces abyssalis]OEU93819.1 hypothetical protein AN215_01820 [Streptomyces abyssalis]OEV32155.1 hypothetical protein AN219_00630 [Streptomyces nanshensis]